MLLGIIILLYLGTARASVGWGKQCSLTEEAQIGSVSVLADQEQHVSTIPAGKGQIFFGLSATADLDTKLVAADGSILLMYDLATDEWVNGCVDCAGSQTFTYHGMTFETCVDECSADKTVTNAAGSTFSFQGDSDYASEWVYISHTTEELHLSTVGYESGDGVVQWLW